MFEKVNIEDLNLKTTKSDRRLLSALTTDLKTSKYVITGFPDDEGIKNNGGRPGASLAPHRIREFLFKMTPPAFSKQDTPDIFDLGNLKLDLDLGQRHEAAITELTPLLLQDKRLLSFGGGHDYGYVDGKSFLNYCQSNKTSSPLIVNFDAHLDVRPMDKGITSGTPFYRLLTESNFDFFEIGLQEQCNSREHLQWLKDHGGQFLSLTDLYETESEEFFNFNRFKNLFAPLADPKRPCFISVDIDAFSNAYAMGCSQSFATGFEPQGFFKMFYYLLKHFDVRVLGIYEVSPPLDFDNLTSKLAALIAYKFIHQQR